MTTETSTEQATGAPGPRRVQLRKPPRRKPVKRGTIWLHRWASLVLGLFLLVECTTGALLVYEPELDRWLRGDAYAPAGVQQGQHLDQSLDAASAAYPDLTFDTVIDDHGTHVVTDYDEGRSVSVDGRTGEVLDEFASDGPAPGWLGWTLSLANNIHLCGLTCEGQPGYVSWLGQDVPHLGWAGFEDDGETYPVTWGGLILGVLGLLLTFLALSGIWLWWPSFRHFARGVRVRFGKGRYARDYDLHQVVGMVAVPLLLMWGLTGLSYEFGFIEKGWYAVTPGQEVEPELTVDDQATGEIGYDEALTAAKAVSGTDSEPTEVDLPAVDDPAGSWSFWFSAGYDPYGHTPYPGDRLVQVDRHDASNAAVTYGQEGEDATQTIYSSFNYPVHSGFAFNGWIRVLWLVAGLVPLLLAWTGVSTWLWKRSVKKRRRRAAATA